MPRRHGWLRDYHHEYDWNDNRQIAPNDDDEGDAKRGSQSPVNITININLGDILSQIAGGKKTAKEALEEMVNNKRGQLLLESGDGE